jgi:hypothetical protein
MSRPVEFATEDSAVVVAETADPVGGPRPVARGDGPAAQATRTVEGAWDGVRAAAHPAPHVLRDGTLRPDPVEPGLPAKPAAEARTAVVGRGAAPPIPVTRPSSDCPETCR